MKKRNITNTIITFVSIVCILWMPVSLAAQSSTDETTIKEVKHEVADAAIAIKDYTVDQRDQAIKKVGFILDDLDASIDKLEERIDKKWDQSTSATRQKMKTTLRKLREQRNEVAEWYGGLKHSSANAWEDMKKGFTNAYTVLVDAWKKAEKEFDSRKTK